MLVVAVCYIDLDLGIGLHAVIARSQSRSHTHTSAHELFLAHFTEYLRFALPTVNEKFKYVIKIVTYIIR